MSAQKVLQLTKYAKQKYHVTEPVDFKLAVDYSAILLAIAGADGELAPDEMQWYLDEQELLFVDPAEYLQAIRNIDWRSVNLEEALNAMNYNIPLNFQRTVMYQAIKMCRADKEYHEDEKAAVNKTAQILGIARDVVVELESIAELEDTTNRLRCSVLGANV